MNVFVFTLGVILIVCSFDLAKRVLVNNDCVDKGEAELLQEIYRGLQRMESRVEALETILIERNARSPYDDARV